MILWEKKGNKKKENYFRPVPFHGIWELQVKCMNYVEIMSFGVFFFFFSFHNSDIELEVWDLELVYLI